MIDTHTVTITTLDSAATAQGQRHTVRTRDLLDGMCAPEARATKDGPAWSPIAWTGDRRAASRAESISCLVYDLDHATPEDLERLDAALTRTGWIHAVHESWTRGRYRLVLPLARPCLPGAYGRLWESAARALRISDCVDPQCSDLARLYYLPSHPHGETRGAFQGGTDLLDFENYSQLQSSEIKDLRNSSEIKDLRNSSEIKDLANPLIHGGGQNDFPQGNENLKILDLDAIRAAAKELSNADTRRLVLQALDGQLHLRKGHRDSTLHRLMSALAFLRLDGEGLSEGVALAIVQPTLASMEGAGDENWKEKARYSFLRASERRAKSDAQSAVASKFFEAENDDELWKTQLSKLEVKGKTVIENHTGNLELILRHAPEFKETIRYNELRREIEVSGGPLAGQSADTMDTALSNYLFAPPWGSRFSRDNCAAAILYRAMQAKYDPVREYLESLPVWDGVRRLDSVLLQYAQAEGNTEHIRTITRKWFISAVARALQPGCQVDTVLVLQGEQGGGKTSFVRTLGNGFAVETRLDIANKDSVMIATANWIVELSELAALKKSDMESVRAFVTTREDQIRLPYGRSVTCLPRRCVFVGTTNALTPLVDQEGNRRFWVVSVGDVDIPGLERVREQLWAEAVHAFRSGEAWWLTKEEAKIAAVEASYYQAENVIESSFIDWLDKQEKQPRELSTHEVAAKVLMLLPAQQTPQILQQVARVLHTCGWKKTRKTVAGRRRTVYVSPRADLEPGEELENG